MIRLVTRYPVTWGAAAVIGLLALTVPGCVGDSWEGTGVVVARHYDDPDEYWDNGPPVYVPIGNGVQIATYPFGQTRVHPARWLLTVEDPDGKRHEVSVDETTYHSCPDGRGYDANTGICSSR